MSFEGKVSTEFALSLAKEYLTTNFPDAILMAACHQNTNHTHIHVLLLAVDIHDKKLHFSPFDYKKLDVGWAKIYAREFGIEKLQQHLDKKQKMFEWKRAKAFGLELDKPIRGSQSRSVHSPEIATPNAIELNQLNVINDSIEHSLASSIDN